MNSGAKVGIPAVLVVAVAMAVTLGLACSSPPPDGGGGGGDQESDVGVDSGSESDANGGETEDCPDDCGTGGVCDDGLCFCQADSVSCDGVCVFTDTDPENCGACGTECDVGEYCAGGECVESCPGDYSECGDVCVDLDVDRSHCGACGNACVTEVQRAFAGCQDGQCQTGCAFDEETMCESEGVCANLDEDEQHCGQCGRACAGPETCRDGDCECPDDGDVCDGECVELESDLDHCGECGHECNSFVEGLLPVCEAGECAEECNPALDDTPCTHQQFEYTGIEPAIYLPVNTSGSLNFPMSDDDDTSRFEEIRQGLDSIADDHHDDVQFGVGRYPTGDCQAGHELDVGLHSAAELQSMWVDYEADGLTPMWEMLVEIRDQDRVEMPGDPYADDRDRAVVLISDAGGESNCEGEFDEVESAVGDLYDDGIETHFILLDEGTGGSLYDDSAEAGGTDEARLVDDGDEIASAFDEIVDELSDGESDFDDCTVTLDEGPMSAEHLWVEAGGELLGSDGWSYDPEALTVTLDDQTCTDLGIEGPEAGTLTVRTGCESGCLE